VKELTAGEGKRLSGVLCIQYHFLRWVERDEKQAVVKKNEHGIVLEEKASSARGEEKKSISTTDLESLREGNWQ